MSRHRPNPPAALLFAFLVVASGLGTVTAGRALTLGRDSTGAKSRSVDNLATRPLAFEPNVGQADPRVSFVGRTSESSVSLATTESVLQSGNDYLRMRLDGSNPAATMEPLDQLSAKSNYFQGSDRSQWHVGVPNFAKVAERGVYPGIDLVYYGTQRQTEYDFVVAPNADPSAIALSFEGARDIRLDRGELVIVLTNGDEIRQRAPAAYQEVGAGQRHPVDSSFGLANGKATFRVGSYDHARPLVIDPVIYSNPVQSVGGGLTEGREIAVDTAGNAYVSGQTKALDFPTVNPQDTYGASDGFGGGAAWDATVFKLDPTGTTLLYSTYLSSSVDPFDDPSAANDYAYAIAVDASGDAYITGFAGGYDFPTSVNAYDRPRTVTGSTVSGSTTFTVSTPMFFDNSALLRHVAGPGIPPGSAIFGVNSSTSVELNNAATSTGSGTFTISPDSDGFVTKLDSTGNLVYSTYLSLVGFTDGGKDIAIDGSGNAYITGFTTDYFSGDGGEFALKMNPPGTALSYFSFLGTGIGEGIGVDSSGNAYVLGHGNSSSISPTVDAYDSTYNGASSDLTITRLDPAGAITYATFLGGGGNESPLSASQKALALAVDPSGRVYVATTTSSVDMPGTAGRFQPSFGGGTGGTPTDAYVAKMDLTLAPASQLLWGTYLGGSANDQVGAIAFDSSANVFVAGRATSVNYPTASPVRGTGADAFLTKLNPNGTGLVYSTHLGGLVGRGVAVDAAGEPYVSGVRGDLVVPPGAPPTASGEAEFALKLTASPTPRATDFNANGTNEVAVFRPNGGTWFAHDTIGADTAQQWGVAGDAPVTGDFDGDGFSDTAIYRPSTALWAIRSSSGGGNTFVTYGTTGDVPVPADYDGDGRADIAVYRPSLGTWFVHRSSDNVDAIATFGALNSDIPVPADYDGDGRADLGIYRDGTWFIHTATNVDASVNWGTTGDIPVAADYDGDGAADFAIYRPSTGLWAIRGTAGTNTFVTYGGIAGDVPVSADYDRDGHADIAIFRPPSGGWFVHRSSDNADAISTWGVPTDIPLPLPIAVWSRFYP